MIIDYTIDYSLIKSNVSIIFELLPKEGLVLENVTYLDIEGDKIKISGQSKGNWTIEGVVLTEVHITLTQSKTTQEIDIINVLVSYPIGKRKLQWESKETAIGSLVFSCKELKINPLKKEEITEDIFLSQLDLVEDLGQFDLFKCELHLIGFSRLELSYLWKSTSNINLHFGNGLIDIDQFTLNGTIGYNVKQKDDSIADTWQRLIFRGNLKLASIETMLELDWNESPQYTVSIQPKEKKEFPDFSLLLKKLKLEAFEKMIDEFNKDLSFLNGISVKKVIGKFRKETFDLNQLVLFADLNCFDAHFELKIIYSGQGIFSIRLELIQGEIFNLNQLIGNLFGSKIHLPANPKIVQLNLSTSFNPVRYSFSTRLLDVWSFSLGAEIITIESLFFSVAKIDTSSFDFKLQGALRFNEIDFELMAEKEHTSSDQGWYLETEIAQSSQIHLKDLITELGRLFHFSLPANIPDITIHDISLGFHTHTHNFHLELSALLKKPGIGHFNEGNLSITIDLTKNDKGIHDFSIDLDGYLKVANTEFDVTAKDIGNKDWSLDLTWDKGINENLSLLDLGKFFNPKFKPEENKDIEKIKGLLTLNHAEIHYTHGYIAKDGEEAKPTTFLIDAKLGKDNEQTIEGLLSGIHPNEEGENWRFIIGIGYEDHTKMPTIGSRIPTEFKLESTWLFVNTSNIDGDNWPPLPNTFPDTLTKQTAQKGIMAVATMDLTQDKHGVAGLDNITKGLPHSTITLLAELEGEGLLIEAMLDGDATIPTGQGHHITIADVSVIFKINKDLNASLVLKGNFELTLDNNPQNLQVKLEVSEYSIVLLVSDKIENNGWKPFGLKSIHIDEIGLELGIDFEPPGARIGVEGKMHFDGQDKNAEELAIVMEFVGPIPNPEYLALEIKQLNLNGLLELFPGSSTHGHNQVKGNLVQVDDFALTWCEKPVVLPDGKTGKIGFSCHGAVEIFNWGAYVSLDVHPQSGIQGFGELSPIKIGPLQIVGNGTGVSIKQKLVNGEWENVSNIKINPNKKTKQNLILLDDTNNQLPSRQHQLVAPGGAIVQFNSTGSPYLNLSANLNLFNLKIAEVDIEVAQDKLVFDLFLQIPLIANFKVHCNIQKGEKPQFDISGGFFLGIHIKFDIPLLFVTIHVDFQFGLDASIEIKKEEHQFSIELKGNINFMGKQISLGDLKIDGIPDSLDQLPHWILTYIETGHTPKFKKHIEDGSGVNNKDPYAKEKKELATEMLVKAKEWAAYVHSDIEKLKAEKGLSIDEINALIDKINADGERINQEKTTSISDNSTAEIKHLNNIQDAVNTKVPDANEQRKNEIEKMQWEVKWIRDESNILRNKIKAEWEEKEAVLVVKEANLIKAQEDYANNKVQEEVLTKAEDDRQNVLQEIKNNVNKLIDEPSKKKFPQRTLDHHYFMFEKARKTHWLKNEILSLGKNHQQLILKEMTLPDTLLKEIVAVKQ